jgi:type IV secretory pathway TraG/TraD family ATPase VirD4
MNNQKTGKIQTVKYAPPPPNLPIYGQINPKEVTFIGRTNYVSSFESKKYIFGIKRPDRRRHVYIIGKTGIGKSKLLEIMARQDIAYGYGLCFIDPHGDMIENLLDFIPEERIKDVVLIDPTDTKYPFSFNPLQKVHKEFRHQFAQDLTEIIKKQFSVDWNPKIEHLFRFTILALLDYPEAVMTDIILMLTQESYRKKVIEFIKDEMIKNFWEFEFNNWLNKFESEAIIPLINKLDQFFSNPLLRNIFSQKESKINLEKIMNENKIILVNLSRGLLGSESSAFLGEIIITKIKQAGMARAKIKEINHQDFYLYIDEFHHVVTDTFENLFSELRKNGLCLTIAHQYMGQLSPKIRSAVLGNSGTIIVFRITGEDALVLKSEMAPIFDVKDMINLGTQEFYIKMSIDGEVYDPFSAESLKILPPPHESFKKKIIEFSRQNYSVLNN